MVKLIDFKDKGASKPNQLNKTDLLKWGKNLLLFAAPTLAVFFGQLALGVNIKVAGAVALLALYQALADLFKKYKSGN